MFGFIKGVSKTAFLATLSVAAITGGSLLIAGPGRTMAVAHELKSKVASAIDQGLDDPIALRRQLVEIEREYPERIGEVRKDLAGLRSGRRPVHTIATPRAVCALIDTCWATDARARPSAAELVEWWADLEGASGRASCGARLFAPLAPRKLGPDGE